METREKNLKEIGAAKLGSDGNVWEPIPLPVWNLKYGAEIIWIYVKKTMLEEIPGIPVISPKKVKTSRKKTPKLMVVKPQNK